MNFRGIGVDGMDVRQEPDGAAAQPLTRQSSIYSLTFDEFQSTMGGVGKEFGSMNMEEFLKNIWTAEESQAVASALGAPPDGGLGLQSGLQRQGSLTLPRTLSQKTVDEVWRDLTPGSAGGVGGSNFQQQQRQPTIGEMTLEEFLVRAGVVREEINHSVSGPAINSTGIPDGSSANITNSVFYGDSLASGNNNSGLSLCFSQAGRNNANIMTSSIPGNDNANLAMSAKGARTYAPQLPLGSNMNSQGMRGGGFLGIGDTVVNNGMIPGMVGLGGVGANVVTSISPANQIPPDGLTNVNGDLSSLSPVPYLFNGDLRGKKRSGAVEKVVERRQRRMIKNRESAARSRARKQAYTMELEAEVAKFKEQNQELQKKQALIMEMEKNRALEALNQQEETKKLCLRRTQTGPW
ncbi:bZIP transcription factor TRAB1-like [Dendrobium catenatum]|uniref:ABSCISIC ACID-INSENSITIVE 5-like protein 5 n=1 Tax=Dendrobium catenatum TaxID=906689 RepID=A0A2I0WXN1_9ASPA|nr:bZIP transcription factor TRAB1-like [Dendrobium catenatum]PKU80416.1 ABSCISIC ACID-INSENSITIVE 5-like protein 5 [Dendrobium catenatum]